ncbi:hypothetical protein F2Q69_00023687 [Brassica cretica]|uniref:Uncharacterized protein n=1 Tax=Brassica cretica TaxID=69181 RepID=A0A8S9QNA1_BRACR|nr:hypothetical protein F2Q69_00023687 [Brassica cretica]
MEDAGITDWKTRPLRYDIWVWKISGVTLVVQALRLILQGSKLDLSCPYLLRSVTLLGKQRPH